MTARALTVAALAKEAFSEHEIRESDSRSWLLQRPLWSLQGLSQGWQSAYSVEIVALRHGSLYVGGDIKPVIFSHAGGTPEELVRWMGDSDDLQYYVRQKAIAGSGAAAVVSYSKSDARIELRSWEADRRQSLSEHHFAYACPMADDDRDGECPSMGGVIGMSCNKLAEIVNNDPVTRIIRTYLGEGTDFRRSQMSGSSHDFDNITEELFMADRSFMEDRGPLGMSLDPKVYYAHAALKRLCSLFDKRDKLQSSLLDSLASSSRHYPLGGR